MPSLPNLAKRMFSSQNETSFYLENKAEVHKYLAKKYGPNKAQQILSDIGKEYFEVVLKPKYQDLEVKAEALESQTKSFQDQIQDMATQADKAAEEIKSLKKQLENKAKEVELLRNYEGPTSTEKEVNANETMVKCLDRSSLDNAAKDIRIFHGQEKESEAAEAAVKLISFLEQLTEVLHGYKLKDLEKLRILKRRIAGDAEAVIAYAKPVSYDEAIECLKERYLDEQRCGRALAENLRRMERRQNEPVLSFGVRLGNVANALAEMNNEDINTPSSFNNLTDILLRSFRQGIRSNVHVEKAIGDKDFNQLIVAVDKAVLNNPELSIKKGNHLMCQNSESNSYSHDQQHQVGYQNRNGESSNNSHQSGYNQQPNRNKKNFGTGTRQ